MTIMIIVTQLNYDTAKNFSNKIIISIDNSHRRTSWYFDQKI
jgi:hypothetical protein